ncbi:MAG TPA: hypothetical protein ENK82_03795, partial [Campylobacterales bacterium]|nr:hypothetical protein [Campylobacterales bacterium]
MNFMLHEIPLNSSSLAQTVSSLENESYSQCVESAIFYKTKGLTKRVIFFYKKALEIQLVDYGRFHKKIAIAYENIAEAYFDEG